MPYTVEYGLKKYIEVLRSNYAGTIAEMLKIEIRKWCMEHTFCCCR